MILSARNHKVVLLDAGFAASAPCLGIASPGDTLASVAKQFGYKTEELAKINNPDLHADDSLPDGFQIILPECDRCVPFHLRIPSSLSFFACPMSLT